MLSTRAIGTVLVAILLAPVPARADTLLIPFFGVNFGGDSGKEFSEAFDTSQYNWGASIAFMGGGVFGFEGDFGYSPDAIARSSRKRISPSLLVSAITKRTRPWLEVSA